MQSLKKLMFESGCNRVVRYWRFCIVCHMGANQLTPLLSYNSLQRRVAVNPVLMSNWQLDTKHLRVRWVIQQAIHMIKMSDFICMKGKAQNTKIPISLSCRRNQWETNCSKCSVCWIHFKSGPAVKLSTVLSSSCSHDRILNPVVWWMRR